MVFRPIAKCVELIRSRPFAEYLAGLQEADGGCAEFHGYRAGGQSGEALAAHRPLDFRLLQQAAVGFHTRCTGALAAIDSFAERAAIDVLVIKAHVSGKSMRPLGAVAIRSPFGTRLDSSGIGPKDEFVQTK